MVNGYVSCRTCIAMLMLLSVNVDASQLCAGNQQAGRNFKYLWGDAMTDATDCIGPTGAPYPSSAVNRMFRGGGGGGLWGNWGSSRNGRGMMQPQQPVMAPHIARKALLKGFELAQGIGADDALNREGRGKAFSNRPVTKNQPGSCSQQDDGMPRRLCKSRYNTTAPLYGVSLTSGQPVTIVQKFPDLLQQHCMSSECEVVRGSCTQTYVPYLFLVIPLGPVTLTGQDYVLVESGCVCRPQHGGVTPDSEGLSAIPPLPDFS
ncbi:hypothetical protein B566_EDAN014088 [Ephemera danica]|nr:hypothetical protein B566_EDAN014088 [Ephemera danica]